MCVTNADASCPVWVTLCTVPKNPSCILLCKFEITQFTIDWIEYVCNWDTIWLGIFHLQLNVLLALLFRKGNFLLAVVGWAFERWSCEPRHPIGIPRSQEPDSLIEASRMCKLYTNSWLVHLREGDQHSDFFPSVCNYLYVFTCWHRVNSGSENHIAK